MSTYNSYMALITEPWFLLSIVAALGYATIEFLDEWLLSKLQKKGGEGDTGIGTLVIISGFFGSLVSIAIATVFFSEGLSGVINNYRTEAVLAGALEVLWLIPYLYALNRSGTIETAPLFQTVPILSLVFGLLFFVEIPTLLHVAAAGLILAGGFMLNFSTVSMRLDSRTFFLMILACAVISIEYFLFKEAALSTTFGSALAWSGLGMLGSSIAILVIVPKFKRDFRKFAKKTNAHHVAVQFFNEALNTVSLIASHLAVVLGPSVMLVSSLNAFHPMFTLAIGGGLAVMGSKKHRLSLSGSEISKKLLSVTLIVLGTVLIAL